MNNRSITLIFFFYLEELIEKIAFFFFQAEDGIRYPLVTGFRRVLFRSFGSAVPFDLDGGAGGQRHRGLPESLGATATVNSAALNEDNEVGGRIGDRAPA